MSQQQPQKTNTHLPLPQRLYHHQWLTRKTAYEQIQHLLRQQEAECAPLNQPIFIGGQQYTPQKLIPLMTDLSDEKHTTVLLKGLTIIELILKRKLNKRGKSEFGKHFLKLVNEGLQKFPLLVQMRNVVLQKFSEILDLIQIQPRILKDKLSLPHEKSIFFALQIISHLDLKVLKNDVRHLSIKHPKQQVRELASEILQELQLDQGSQQQKKCIQQDVYDQNFNYNQNGHGQSRQKERSGQHQKKATISMKKKDKSVQEASKANSSKNSSIQKRNYLLEQMPHFKKINSKQQQGYSCQLLQNIDMLLQSPLPTTLDFAHYIRLMIEDSNFIISTNGIKILTSWLKNETTMNQVPTSYPLLFFFDKFKMHSTHQINGILFELTDALIKSGRVIDLMQAAADGLGSAKANVKYGSGLICIRIVSIMHGNQDLFYQNIQGEKQFPTDIQIPLTKYKNIQKYLQKCCDLMSKDKDKTLKGIADSIRIQMGYTFQTQSNASKSKNKVDNSNRMKNMMNNSANTRSNQHINSSIPTASTTNNKQTLQSSGSMTISTSNNEKQNQQQCNTVNTNKTFKAGKNDKVPITPVKKKVVNSSKKPEQLINKIAKLASQPNLYSERQLTQVLTMFTNEVQSGLSQGKYSLFYLTEVLQSLLRNYVPHQETAPLISQFLIVNIRAITNSSQKNKFSTVQNQQHLSIILKISLCDIVLGRQLRGILNNLSINYSMRLLINVLNSVQGKVRKKNRQFLIEWLNSQVSVDLLNQEYYQILRKINSGQILNEKYARKQQRQKQQIMRQRQRFAKEEQINVKIDYDQFGHSQKPILGKQDRDDRVLENYQENQQRLQPIQAQRQIVKPVNKFKESLKKYTRQIQTGQIDQQEYDKNRQIHSQNYQKQLKSTTKNYPSYQQLKSKPYIKIDAQKEASNKKNPIQMNSNLKYVSSITERESEYSELSEMHLQISQIAAKQQEQSYDHNYGLPSLPTSNKKQEYDQKWDYFLTKHKNQLNTPRQENTRQKFEVQIEAEINLPTHKQLFKKKQNDQSDHKIQQLKKWFNNYHDSSSEQGGQVQFKTEIDKKTFGYKYSPVQQQEKTSPRQLQDEQVNEQSSEQYYNDQKNQEDQDHDHFQYEILNIQKMNYMCNCTANPYPHLRSLILTPFKTHPRKHHFLQQLTHYFSHKQLKTPQPYNAILLTTILLFSQIKTDKSLISPLQHLYQYLASLSSTNFFIKTLLSLMHSVIEETQQSCRSFLITILSKSMSRLLPFSEDPVQLLRDIQQFYQIGQMVYFEMYTAQYGQIRSAIEGSSLEDAIKKAFQSQGRNLIVIVQGWLETDFKWKVKQCLEKLESQDIQQTA